MDPIRPPFPRTAAFLFFRLSLGYLVFLHISFPARAELTQNANCTSSNGKTLLDSLREVLPRVGTHYSPVARKLLTQESGPASGDAQCVSQGVNKLCPYVDPLPCPAVVAAQGDVHMGIYECTQEMHRDLPPTPLFCYGPSLDTATVPGPTFEATVGTPVKVTWDNQISAAQHPLPVDPTIHRAVPSSGVPVVTHLHGGETASEYDGYPEAWYTKGGEKGLAYTTNVYTYGNTQDPTTLWYHDHTLGYTRLNIQMGLVGFYLLRKPSFEKPLKLPTGGFEVPLAFKDYSYTPDGKVLYPSGGSGTHPNWEPEFFGDTMTVNGMAWPYFEVLPRKYRFRLLNACNARFLDLSFSNGAVSFYQIGTDGGYLTKPVQLGNILMGPAERADVIVDFKGVAHNTEIVLKNGARAPYPGGDPPSENAGFGGTAEVMKFIVRKNLVKSDRPKKGAFAPGKAEPAADAAVADNDAPDDSQVPGFMQNLPTLQAAPAIVERWLTLSESDANGGVETVQLGTFENEKNVPKAWRDPVTETPRNGGTELWHVINFSEDAHPIHVHLVKFRLVSRYSYDDTRYANGQCKFVTNDTSSSCIQSNSPQPIDENEAGWKDTVRMYPGQVTTIVLRFESQSGAGFAFDPTKGPGYVWHCHIVDHEDNDMMRPYKVIN